MKYTVTCGKETREIKNAAGIGSFAAILTDYLAYGESVTITVRKNHYARGRQKNPLPKPTGGKKK